MTAQHKPLQDAGDKTDSPISWEPSRAVLKYTIAAQLAAAVAIFAALRIFAPEQIVRTGGSVLIALVALIGWYLLARGRIRATVKVLAYGVWIVATGVAVFTGGVRAPGIISYPVIILVFGWLISWRSALHLTGLTLLTTAGFVAAELWGILPAPLTTPAALYGAVQCVVAILALLLIGRLGQSYQNRIRELRSLGSDLALRTQDLEATKVELNRAQTVGNVGSWVYDIAGDTMRLSDETCRIFGLPEGATGNHDSYLASTHADDRNALNLAWQAALRGVPFDHEHRIVVGGAIRWIRQKAELEFAADGTARSAVGIAQDITERKRTEEELRESGFRWKFAIEGSGDGVWDWNIQTDEAQYSRRWKEMLGYSEADILPTNQEWVERIHPDDRLHVAATMQAYLEGRTAIYVVEYRLRCKDESYKWILGRGMVVSRDGEGKPLRMIGTHTDITERKQMEEQVRRMAFYDPLTKLPNRRLVNDRLSQTMAANKRSGGYGALMFLDLDNFKPLNDTHGHEVGDLLLIEVAARLRKCVREMDTVARFGGDEFVVMVSELNTDQAESVAQAAGIAEKIRNALSNTYLLTLKQDGKADVTIEHHCTASIGVALFANHEGSLEDIIKRADRAMYQAKEAGRNAVRFHETVAPAAARAAA